MLRLLPPLPPRKLDRGSVPAPSHHAFRQHPFQQAEVGMGTPWHGHDGRGLQCFSSRREQGDRINPAFPGGDQVDREQTRRWREGIDLPKLFVIYTLGLHSGLA